MNIYLKTLLAIILGMGTALGLVYLFTLANNASKETILGRVAQAQEALPKIIEEENELMLFFGSSMVGAGFSPRQFDRQVKEQGKNIKSFNFGFGGLNPYFQDYLARRIRDSFQHGNRKLKLSIIEFNPFQASQARWNGAKSVVDSFLTMLATDEEIVSKRNEINNKLNEAFEREYPDYDGSDWSYAWQGGGTIPEERSAETLALFDAYYPTLQTEANLKNRLNHRILSADIEEMHFEPQLIESFIQIVQHFQQISEKVDIVLLPRNFKWVKYTPDGKKRLAEAIKKIETATGITIKNHQTVPGIDDKSFRDATHLARYRGDITYTSFLVNEYIDDL